MTLRIGFLGYRFMGRAHANAIARLPMFFPDAPETARAVVIGRDADALSDAATRLGFSETATDWESAIDEVDVLYNLGPNALHPDPAIAALEDDVAVLSEKPLAHTLPAAERMAAAARDSDAVAGVAFNYRFLPAIQRAKRLLDSGALGTVRQVRARYLQDWLVDPDAPWSWRLDADVAGSGALGDLGAHVVDLVRFLVGDVERVSGHCRTFVDERPTADGTSTRAVTVDDAVTVQAALRDGAMATVEASRVAPGHENDLHVAVHGSAGSLRFGLERLNELAVAEHDAAGAGPRPSGGYRTTLVTSEGDPYVDHWWPPGHVLGWEHAVVHENYEFLSAVAGDRPFRPDFADGLAVQRVLDAVERSDDEGRWVPVAADS
jgi:predicted dehydrogenase